MAQKKTGFLSSLYDALASLKLTIVLFLTLAALSIIGTLLPQGLTAEMIEKSYSSGVAWLITKFGLYDLYHTGWFQFLLFLLCVNLVVCTLQRLPKTLKLMSRREETIDPGKLEKFGNSAQFFTKLPLDTAKERIDRAIREELSALKPVETPAGAFAGVAEKGRWSLLMVYVVHLSVLFVLFGALLGSLFGFKGHMSIPEGETMGEVELAEGDRLLKLPFAVRCDKFQVSFYDTGMPKEFVSDLAILQDGKEVHKQSIRVNDPLTWDGVTLYQSSYGSVVRKAELEVTDRNTGKLSRITLPYREPVKVPETEDEMTLLDYQQDLGQFGPAIAVAVLRPGQEPTGSWILVNMPSFHGNKVVNYQIKVLNTQTVSYTGLQVKKDPGIWVVYIGFIAMMVGIAIAFYSTQRKIWVWTGPAAEGKQALRVVLAGRASKNSLAFEEEFKKIAERVQNELKA